MTNLICDNGNGVIYIGNDDGEVFGVVSSTRVTDGDGVAFQDDTFTVLERNGFNLEQDFETEETFVEFVECNGETSKLVFSGDVASIE